jgi:hypothetical protein
MAKTLTKAELAAQLEASHVAYEKLATHNASILAQIAALQQPAAAQVSDHSHAAAAAQVSDHSHAAQPSNGAVRDAVIRLRCAKCSGSGRYGEDGDCYRCEGKGYQTEADRRRNWGYAQFNKPVAAAAAKPTYVPAAPTADVLARRAAMATAKAAAIAGNCVVTV